MRTENKNKKTRQIVMHKNKLLPGGNVIYTFDKEINKGRSKIIW